MSDYRKLRVWEKAEVFATRIYKLTGSDSFKGYRELVDQMRAAAESIPFNVAEGSGHRSRKEFARFVTYSIASSCELENQINLARDIKAISYADGEKLGREISEIRKMLRGFLRRLEE